MPALRPPARPAQAAALRKPPPSAADRVPRLHPVREHSAPPLRGVVPSPRTERHAAAPLQTLTLTLALISGTPRHHSNPDPGPNQRHSSRLLTHAPSLQPRASSLPPRAPSLPPRAPSLQPRAPSLPPRAPRHAVALVGYLPRARRVVPTLNPDPNPGTLPLLPLILTLTQARCRSRGMISPCGRTTGPTQSTTPPRTPGAPL